MSIEHIDAKVICDSVNPVNNKRQTTFQIRVPRIILAEFNTHKQLCKNFASSRAIPTKVLRNEAWNDPFIPVYWGAAQKGMSADTELVGWRKTAAKFIWIMSSKTQCFYHWMLEKIGLHKQTCNRLIEPWLSVTGVTTATEWDNFFKLRCSPMAQPEMQKLACKMRDAMNESVPRELTVNEPHLPFIDEEEREKFDLADQIKISVARCCRTSYNNMLGKKSQPEEDIKLFERATTHEHWSPCEHQGFVPKDGRITKDKQYDLQRGFRGFYQLRAFLDNKNNTHYLKDWYGIDINGNKS